MLNFKKLVAPLAAHPDIWLVRAQFRPGASPASIARAEQQLGAPLHPDIKTFYQHHNGLALEWMFKPTDRFRDGEYEVDTSELPFWMDLMGDIGPPSDGQIVVASIGEVIINSYDEVEEYTDFDPHVAYVEYIEEPAEEDEPVAGTFTFGERQFASYADFRAQLRLFDSFAAYSGTLLLFEPGKSNPDVLYSEDHWFNCKPDVCLPLSQYIRRLAYDFGLRWQRDRYFRNPVAVPTVFDPAMRLAELLATTKFPGDLRG